jgi:tetratricopeptide (TPR) repeat protein
VRAGPAIGLALWCCLKAAGQFAPLPQAESPEEFDAYLSVLEAREPAAVIRAGEAFARSWAGSPLRGHVYELEFEAYRALGDAEKAILAADQSLAAAPDNLMVLANLAVVLANGTRDPKRLGRAEELARKVIALTKSFRVPRFIGPGEWAQIDGRLNSQAHAALGLVANQRGNLSEAIREFESAVALAPSPDATQLYRLGVLHRTAGNLSGARKEFRRAAESGDRAIRELAERELRQLEPR